MAGKVLASGAYRRLRDDVEAILSEARERAERAAAQALVQAYWKVGDRIRKAGLSDSAGYGDAVVQNLAADLELSERTLYHALALRKAYKRPPSAALSWAHYRELLRLKHPDARRLAEQSAVAEKLSSKALQRAITSGRFDEEPSQAQRRAKRAQLARPDDPSYLYRASVHSVVDADTLVLDIDLGFEVIKRQRVRLALIDAPDRKVAAGRAARDYVLSELAPADFVVVKTDRVDVHGRYVGHIFYAHTALRFDNVFTRGRYLNQRLVDEGHARAL